MNRKIEMILIIEEENVIGFALRNYLSKHHVNVHYTGDWDEARRLLENEKIKCLISTDTFFCDSDNTKLIASFVENKNVPLLITTSEPHFELASKPNVMKVFRKPYMEEEVNCFLEKLILN